MASADKRLEADDIFDIESEQSSASDVVSKYSGEDLVKWVTAFASGMTVVIMAAKLSIYIVTRAAVVNTSFLDSVGDFVANMITLATSYMMRKVDTKTFPAGKATLEPVGVLVFSTLMAATMFANLLNNIDDLFSPVEESREDAVWTFWNLLFNTGENWSSIPSSISAPSGLPQPLRDILMSSSVEGARAAATPSVELAAEVPDPQLEFRNMRVAVIVLGCTASYKLCLWLFCICFAIPRTGSDILQALANDKRNDVLATSFAIASLLVGHFFQDELGNFAEKLDPLSSAILSCFIIATWLRLVWEQILLLSRRSADKGLLEELSERASEAVSAVGYRVRKVQACYSGRNYAVEVELLVPDASACIKDVLVASDLLVTKLKANDHVEEVRVRTIIGGIDEHTENA